MKMINFKKKIMKLFRKAQQKLYENAKLCYIYKKKKKCENKYFKYKKVRKVRDHCHYTEEYRGTVHSIYELKYSVPKKISADFHNGSNYGYNFILKEIP